ncbi:MAG: hypothetical protein J5762_05495, partial [Clostridia bacterium]|nr:hypothetical protein [Clostridia bacterium]
NGGNVNIYGGVITANGGESASGIGGGNGRNGGNVNIYGGVITANGGESASGIGGGYFGDGGDVNIYGGVITANSGEYGAVAIGAGSGSIAHGTLTVAESGIVYGGISSNPTTVIEKSDNDYKRYPYMIVTVPETEPVTDYYLVGTMNDWTISDNYKLTKNEAATGEEYSIELNLAANDELKIKSDGGTRYPDQGDNYVVTAGADYIVFFRPNFDGGDDWYYGCIYVMRKHQHDYSTDWTHDENTHWHACTGEGACDAPKADEAAHTYGDDITETAYYTCSVCSHEDSQRKAEYDSVQAENTELDQEAVNAVKEMIAAIGAVAYTPECKAKISEARAAYAELSGVEKDLVDNYDVLMAAEDAYLDIAERKAGVKKHYEINCGGNITLPAIGLMLIAIAVSFVVFRKREKSVK